MNYPIAELEQKTIGSEHGLPLLCLHGWGTDLNTFDPLTEQLTDRFQVFSFSFPGFGRSPEPSEPWSVSDYVALTENYVRETIGRSPYAILAHSFGGRVTAGLCDSFVMKDCKKLILIGAAGIRPKRPVSYYIKVYGYKAMKFLSKIPGLHAILKRPIAAYRNRYASDDYARASTVMQATLSKVVKQDLSREFSKLSLPSLLIWGKADDQTPIDQGRRMHHLIADSGLVELDGGHFIYLEKKSEVQQAVRHFLTDASAADEAKGGDR
ncbi:MAG: alpha/beta hydrolase [Bacillota bacterium]|nr:alpha/beta hydrolase [Bacillota bacterium]